jgi:hypothetical protein
MIKEMKEEMALKSIENLRPFYYREVQKEYGMALMKSIVRMLKKLEIQPDKILVYDRRMATLRGLRFRYAGDMSKYLFYGVSYKEYENPFNGLCEMDGKSFSLQNFYVDSEQEAALVNYDLLGVVNIDDIETLNKIYNYLRKEVKAPKMKKHYTIQENNYHFKRLNIQ